MDDGAGGTFSNRDESEIGNKHYLRSHTVTFSGSEESLLFRFRMRATNEIGSIESSISNQLLAGVPVKPSSPPLSDATQTGPSTVSVTWTPVADTGGSDIVTYSLEIDDGIGGDFISLFDTNYLKLEYTYNVGIIKGRNYRVRYRARNSIGWSEYSDIRYVLAAKVPLAPPQPMMISTDATSINLEVPRC